MTNIKILILVCGIAIFGNTAAQEIGSLSSEPDNYKFYPELREYVVCQEDEINAVTPQFLIKEDKVESTPGHFRFAYTLYDPKSNSSLFTLECADIFSAEIDGEYVRWPKQYSFRAVIWVHTWSTEMTGPANSIVGTSTYKELKSLNWGCQSGNKDLPFVYCHGMRVWMEFDLPEGLYGDEFNDVPTEIMDQAILSKISITTHDLTREKLPQDLQIYLNKQDGL